MSRNRRFDLDESSQLLIRAHNETPSVANARQQQYLAPVIVGGRDPAHAESGFAEIVSDNFPSRQ